MLRFRDILGVAGAIVIFCASCTDFSATNEGGSDFATNEYGTNRFVINNVELKVLIPSVIKVDQPVPITVELTNNSDHTILYDDGGAFDGLGAVNLDLLTSSYHLPYLTARGRRYFGQPESSYIGFKESDFTELKPGETAKWPYDLRDYFQLPSDNYRISVFVDIYKSHHIDQGFSISVSDIMFQVKK
jgi:hypothetical protein